MMDKFASVIGIAVAILGFGFVVFLLIQMLRRERKDGVYSLGSIIRHTSRWQYLVVEKPFYIVDQAVLLNSLGRDGWELQPGSDTKTFLLKRPLRQFHMPQDKAAAAKADKTNRVKGETPHAAKQKGS